MDNELLLPDWHTYQAEFAPGDQRLQIIIPNVVGDDWQRLIDFLRSTQVELTLYRGETTVDIPGRITPLVHHEPPHQFVIGLDGIQLLFPMTGSDSIRLLLAAGEIDSEAKAGILFRLISTTGRTLHKSVMLIRENIQDAPVFVYTSGAGLRYLKNPV